jgi:fructan beta-fructosidase
MNPQANPIHCRHPLSSASIFRAWLAVTLISTANLSLAQTREDIMIADFEGDTYGAWKTTGTAFGPGPARGTLPGQMTVTGCEGKGLVNSFHGGDASTGTLESPPFEIKRRYVNFLIGGGKYPGRTCLELLVDGKPVRVATGPNDQPGGSERLDWASWEVADFLGKTAILRIIDLQTGGWGHINVDQIVQSETNRGPQPVKRQFVLNHRFIHLPVKRDAPPRSVKYTAEEHTLSVFEIRLPERGQAADFWVFIEEPETKGQTISFETTLPAGSTALGAITQSDDPPGADTMYREKLRPQIHFTSRRGWLNDPNGLVWNGGQYHLFYQHNPFGWEWGNMHWGHAVSPDLLHWTELPQAISPRQFGDWAFSGSAVVDHDDRAGFGRTDRSGAPGQGKGAIVAAFTSTGRGECIAHYDPSDSRQRFYEYDKNPVVKHQGRDPRLLWHKQSGRWIMAVYDEFEGKQWIAFHSSPDLKAWTFESRIEGFFECPDLFELAVAGQPGRSRWALYGGDGAYLLGQFDGKKFTPDSITKERTWYGNFYAAQTFSDTADGRRIQIGWGNGITFPGMPFNQQMTIPCELTLRSKDEGIRMFAVPVAELATLRLRKIALEDQDPSSIAKSLTGIFGDFFEIRAIADVAGDAVLTLTVRGVPIIYDVAKKTLTCGDKTAPLAPESDRLTLQILVDRGSIEIFGNDGRVAISHGVIPQRGVRPISASVSGQSARFRLFEVNELKSVWR